MYLVYMYSKLKHHICTYVLYILYICTIYIYNSPDVATPLAVLFGPLGDVSVVKTAPKMFNQKFCSRFPQYILELLSTSSCTSCKGFNIRKVFRYEGAEIRSRVQFWIVFLPYFCFVFWVGRLVTMRRVGTNLAAWLLVSIPFFTRKLRFSSDSHTFCYTISVHHYDILYIYR